MRKGMWTEAYTKAGYREKYAMDNGYKTVKIDHRGHEMWKFIYSSRNEYQDANGATFDTTERRWVG